MFHKTVRNRRRQTTRNLIIHSLASAALLCLPASELLAAGSAPEGVPAEITGTLTVLHTDDIDHKKSEFLYFLEDVKSKRKWQVRLPKGSHPNVISGATVKIRGRQQGDNILYAEGDASIQTIEYGAAVVSGEQNTLVLVTNFADSDVSCPVSAVEDIVFSDPNYQSIDDLYQETSFGNVSFTGAVASVNIDALTTDTCSIGNWAGMAEAAAKAAKINVDAYQRRVYIMPSTTTCGFIGAGTVGGNPSRSWVFRCDLADVYAHELGHNLGMGHAATPTHEYGDRSDIMGVAGPGLRQINAPHKEQMGWLPPEQAAAVTSSGTFDIAPLEIDPQQTFYPQTLKIAKPDTGDFYYLSYRQPIGFDKNLRSEYLNTLSIHRYKGNGMAYNTFLLQSLTDGGSFTDSVNGISVTQLSHDKNRVTLQVQMDSSCQSALPSVAITPSDQSGTAGKTLSYGVSVTNTDWSGCPQSTFDLAGSFPAGWAGKVSPRSLSLAPGQSGSAVLSVTSPGTASDGSYGIAIATSSTASASHSASGKGTYTVTTPSVNTTEPTVDSEPPTAPASLSASVKRNQVSLSWSASSDNVGVAGYRIWRDKVNIGTVTDTRYNDGNVTSGATYTYYVTAFDAAGNVSSPSGSVTVSIGTSGGGNGNGNKRK